MSDLAERSGEYWDEHNLAASEDVSYWLAVPELRRRVNESLTGDPNKLYIQGFIETFKSQWPVERVLSVGCGAGDLERGVASQGIAKRVDGIDVSRKSLVEAEACARAEGLGAVIKYTVSEALEWLKQEGTYDVIFFHGVLHHLQDLEEVLGLAGERVRGGNPGLIYIDEYVGPSRDEWTDDHLKGAAHLFDKVASTDRRTPEAWAPIAMEDPTEMIRSSEIERVVRDTLTMVEWQPYYGNIVFPLVNAIRGSRLPAYSELLVEAWEEERRLIESGAMGPPCYAAMVAQTKH